MSNLRIFDIARLAVRSLLTEAAVYPKPGLVTPLDAGSHADMDFQSFLDSAMALLPCFLNCASIGMETLELGPEDVFGLLRVTGRQGEWEMLRATGGANTHKGAVFLLGLLCAAAGRLATQERDWPTYFSTSHKRTHIYKGGSPIGRNIYCRAIYGNATLQRESYFGIVEDKQPRRKGTTQAVDTQHKTQ